MKPISPICKCTLLTVAMLLFAACANQMEPAKQALDGANSAVSAAAADARKYMPEHLSTLQRKLSDLKSAFDRKDYAAVLASAPAVVNEAKSLAQAAASKKAELAKALETQWTDLNSSMPRLIETVKTRVDALAKKKHVPKGVDLAAARSALADATISWEKAQSVFTAGKVEEAVSNAKDSKAKAEAAAAAVNLKLPTAGAAAR
jgi:hypothetical protein